MQNRREWLKGIGCTVMAPSVMTANISAVGQGESRSSGTEYHEFDPDVELKLTASSGRAPIWEGPKTPILRFFGEVIKGRKGAVRESGGFLGPILDFVRGEKIRIIFENRLEEPTIVHWHGMIVPEAADGHPQLAIEPGETYTYEFEVINRAGTYWYHTHPHGRTGYQVYHGLAGVLLVRDPDEDTIGLPSGQQEHVMVIQDRRVDEENRFRYKSGMADQMMGVLGDRILVNGQANKTIEVSRSPNRLRLLNLSNARLYKLAWSDGSPMQVIGTDGGLLSNEEGPLEKPFVVLGPAERVELWKDFSSRPALSEISLISEEFSIEMAMGMGPRRQVFRTGDGRGPGMMGMISGVGDKIEIATFRIADEELVSGKLPVLPERKLVLPEVKRTVETRLGFRMMQGFLNGKQWNMDDMKHVDPDEVLVLNKPVAWTFENVSEPGMLMPHPMHLHGVQFRVLERKGNGAGELAKGIVDVGDKDTVMVFAGETVTVQFTPTIEGLFLYHCHNLEHEDAGMMRNFRVDRS